MFLIELPYLGKNATAIMSNSFHGYDEVSNTNMYSNVKIRNVYIIRIDIIKYLNEYFSSESLVNDREAIYSIIAGKGYPNNKDLVNSALEYYYIHDDTFKMKFSVLCYFKDNSIENLSVYDSLIKSFKKDIEEKRSKIKSIVPYTKLLFESQLYMYMSINNSISYSSIKDIIGIEVISLC